MNEGYKSKLEKLWQTSADLTAMSLSYFVSKDIKFINNKVNFTNIENIKNIINTIGEHEYVSLIHFTGDINVKTGLYMNTSEIKGLVEVFFSEFACKECEELTDLEVSALLEITNIVGNSFSSSIANHIGCNFMSSEPQISYCTKQVLIDEEMCDEEYIVICESTAEIDGKEIVGKFLFLPSNETIQLIQKKIGDI